MGNKGFAKQTLILFTVLAVTLVFSIVVFNAKELKIKALNTEVDNLNSYIDQKNHIISELDKEIENNTESIEFLEDKNTELNIELNKKIRDLENVINELNSKIDDLNKTIDSKNNEIKNLNKKIKNQTSTSSTNSETKSSTNSSKTESSSDSSTKSGKHLTKRGGVFQGPSGKETYYNLNMNGVLKNIVYGTKWKGSLGLSKEEYPYWVREDGCKMIGPYIMCAANLDIRPYGTIVETSLGKAMVVDTGSFAKKNKTQIDIAVNW